jgi:hypothetical protein
MAAMQVREVVGVVTVAAGVTRIDLLKGLTLALPAVVVVVLEVILAVAAV